MALTVRVRRSTNVEGPTIVIELPSIQTDNFIQPHMSAVRKLGLNCNALPRLEMGLTNVMTHRFLHRSGR